ncbi:hypothetical protein [Enterococcus sp. AZ173]|jgi:hypothetical protein|uniref:hypothetical protein n=1 Tax=Enterococcus sp. AZ173 TaxID=2774700 RepID=UPI003D2D5923
MIDINYEKVIFFFSVGVILSGLTSFFYSYIPGLEERMILSIVKENGIIFADRLSGLKMNPNHYSLDVNIALSCLLISLYWTTHKLRDLAYISILLFLGFSTLSRSFYAATFLTVVLFIFVAILKKSFFNWKFFFSFTTVMIIGGMFLKDQISTFLTRFNGADNDFTNGRTDLFAEYVRDIFSDAYYFLFGHGLFAMSAKDLGTHNFFLELLFTIGFFGTIIFLFLLRSTFFSFKYKLISYIPLIIFLFRGMAINLFLKDTLYILLIVIYSFMIDSLQNRNLIKDKL